MQCPSCGYENQEDAQYCNLCQYSFYRSGEQSSARDLVSAIENRVNTPDFTIEKPGWFERHLNLTWLIADIAVYPVFLILGNLFLFITGKSPTLFLATGLVDYPFYIDILSVLLGFVSTFVVGGWVLVKKARSLGWLLIFLLGPVGVIIFLCLKNKSDEFTASPEASPDMPPAPAEPSRS